MRILALDLGTKTGWASYDATHRFRDGGTWRLATDKELRRQKLDGLDRCCDIRPARLLARVGGVVATHIFFEDVQFLSTQLQSQLWASLRAMVTLQHPTTVVRAVPVGTIKKFGSGHGNATKEMMAAAFAKKHPEILVARVGCPPDDNEIDAQHLLDLAIKELKLA